MLFTTKKHPLEIVLQNLENSGRVERRNLCLDSLFSCFIVNVNCMQMRDNNSVTHTANIYKVQNTDVELTLKGADIRKLNLN